MFKDNPFHKDLYERVNDHQVAVGAIDNNVQDGMHPAKSVLGIPIRIDTTLTGSPEIKLGSWGPNTSDCVARYETPLSYDELAAKTDGDNDFYDDVRFRVACEIPYYAEKQDHSKVRLLHASLGIQTEGGEFADVLKKHLFYGRPLDYTNLREELGDLLWYIALAAKALDTTIAQLQDQNIAKLKARFGDKFSQDAAVNRDLDKERKVLEDNEGVS